MTRVEYRIEQVPLNQNGPPTLQLVERLAELGRQGWHVASVDLTPHPSYEAGPVTVLLERELAGGEAPAGDQPPVRAVARGAGTAADVSSPSRRTLRASSGPGSPRSTRVGPRS